eukprot:1138247-Pelagomonas_calceolata.AAC.3
MVALVPLKPQPPPNTTPAGPSTASSPPQAAPAAQPNSAAQPAATADRHEASSSGDGGSDICAQRTEGDEAEGHAKRKAAAGDQVWKHDGGAAGLHCAGCASGGSLVSNDCECCKKSSLVFVAGDRAEPSELPGGSASSLPLEPENACRTRCRWPPKSLNTSRADL